MCLPHSASTWTLFTCSASCYRSWEVAATESSPPWKYLFSISQHPLGLFQWIITFTFPPVFVSASDLCKQRESHLLFFCFWLHKVMYMLVGFVWTNPLLFTVVWPFLFIWAFFSPSGVHWGLHHLTVYVLTGITLTHWYITKYDQLPQLHVTV